MLYFLLSIVLFGDVYKSFAKGSLIVKTENGLVVGKQETTRDLERPYYSFQGIPFAKPPVADLRFKAPQPHDNWDGIYFATSLGNECLQSTNLGSEDCLFINVYVPKTATKSNLLPVMVWIYGGGFFVGNSDFAADFFLDEDIILVTFNYRLGVFGFLSTEDEAAYGNWGLKDQILALKWVQKNIENFGGSKDNVTIFGQSAGSASVSYLVQSPQSKNLFQRAIMQSGSSLNLWSFSRNPKDLSFALGTSLNIHTENTTTLIEKLRDVDANDLFYASLAINVGEELLTSPLDGLAYAPCAEPYHEDAAVLGYSHENLKNGNFNRVPVIIGYNSQEGLPFYYAFEQIRLYLLTFDVLPAKMIPIDMNILNSSLLANISNEIKTRYFSDEYIVASQLNLSEFITDDQFVRPINEAARLMSKWVPTYHYRFSYMPNSTNDTDSIGTGVPHSGELTYMLAKPENLNQTGSDLLTRQRLIKLWTNFAKTGNPTPEMDSLLGDIIWETYSDNERFLDIGNSLILSSNTEKYSLIWWREFFNKYGTQPFNTY